MQKETLHEHLTAMNHKVEQLASVRRSQSTAGHKHKTGVRPVNFTTGDYVLKTRTRRGRKLELTWFGPFRVTECRSEYIFEVGDLVSKEKSFVHGRRLKHFGNAECNIIEYVLQHLDCQQGELLVIKRFDDIREKNRKVECLVKWKGSRTTRTTG